MDQKFDVVALGELLIDFTQNGLSEQGNPLLEANPGGAPCNVLAMLQKLGKSTAFVGKVGDDMFGRQLRGVVEKAGIDLTNLVMDPAAHTTLAFVQTFENGDRDFSFYRDPGADMLLTADEVPGDVIAQSRIFHFGTLSMTHSGVREATKKAVACAKDAGVMVSFDPNLRPPLWADLEDAKAQIAWGLGQCDVLKIADNELEFMTSETDFDKGTAILREQYPNIRILNVTAGADGSYSYYGGKRVFVPSCKLGGVIETTGAGDTFCASVLNFVLEHGVEGLTEDDLTAMLRFANAAAYIVTTRKGAIRSMPEKAERVDGKLFYAAKHVEDGENAYMVGWARRSGSMSSTVGVTDWAGNLAVQKIVQKENGDLVLAPVDAVTGEFTNRRALAVEDSHIYVTSEEGYAYTNAFTCYESFLLSGEFCYTGDGTFGLSFDFYEDPELNKFITINPAENMLQLWFNEGTTLITETAVDLQPGETYSFTYIQEGSVGIFYIDGIASLTVRLYGASGKPIQLFAENNSVLFSSLREYTRP